MSLMTVSSLGSVTNPKLQIFQDLPILTRNIRLNVIDLDHCDKQVVNELIYRWCRVLTRKRLPEYRATIIDLVGSINPIRLATILKRDADRMRLINIIRQCKINCTVMTVDAEISRECQSHLSKLFVIYMDEFFIVKVLDSIRKLLSNKCQVVLVVPRLDRQTRDILDLIATNQVIRCDFVVDRREIGPAPAGMINESYAKYLNQIYVQRSLACHNLPDRIEGELNEDGLHLAVNPQTSQARLSLAKQEVKANMKRIKTEF